VAINSDLVERAIAEISKRRANYEYFFERLSSPEWIVPLKQRGLFDDPPPTEIVDGGVRAPAWPPSQFLARVASSAPEEALAVMLEVSTDNERIHADFAEAAASMPPPLARRWAEHELSWLREDMRFYFLLPHELAKLIQTLAAAGEVDVALAIAEKLFRLRPPTSGLGVPGDLERATPRFSSWEYGELIGETAQALREAAAEETVRLLVRLLKSAIKLSYPHEGEPSEDYSQVWRPRLAVDEDHDRDVRHALASALRDTAAAVRQRAAVADLRLLDLLAEGQTRIFRRIAAFALGNPLSSQMEALARILLDREVFFEGEPSPEYRALLSIGFGHLDGQQQQTVLDWIEEGPDLDEYLGRRVRADGETPTVQEVDRYVGRWQIRRLRLIRDSLPERWALRYENLVERLGDAEFVTSYEVTAAWVGPESPIGTEELGSRSDGELLELLRTYAGTAGWFGPSREGLARTLSELAENDPERVTRLAPRFSDLPPVYAYWMLIGLGKAIQQGRAIMWSPLLTLLDLIIDTQHDTAEVSEDDEDNYGRWEWVRKEAAAVLESGFRQTDSAIPLEFRQQAWKVVERLTHDTDPTPEYEERYGGSSMDPATLALNTTRGRAMHATVTYALWVRRAIESEHGRSGTELGFDVMPEVRRVLDDHLDPDQDSSTSVRAVYGQWFPWLALLDKAWSERARGVIFPQAQHHGLLRDAAWYSYIIFCRPFDTMLEILRSQYSYAVDRQGDAHPPWRWAGGVETPQQRLAAHLLSFFWRGLIDLNEDDELLERLFAFASVDTRVFAIGFVGRVLRETENLNDDVRERLERLWEWRIREAGTDRTADQQAEIAAFAWWADADTLTPEWRLEQLERVLSIGGSLKPESVALRALERLARRHPLRTARVLQVLLDREKAGWAIQGSRGEIENILRVCLSSNNPEAATLAEGIAHWLGSLGYGGFRELVKRRGS